MAKTSKMKTWRATFLNGATMLIDKKCLADAYFDAEAWANCYDDKGNLLYGALESVELAW